MRKRIVSEGILAGILMCLLVCFPVLVSAEATSGSMRTWARVFNGPGGSGAYINSRQQQVRQTLDGGYIAVANYTPYGTSATSVWVVKFDAAGNLSWQRIYNAWGDDYANAIEVSADGGYVVAGYTSSFGTGYTENAWIMKIDAQGNIVWQKYIGFETAGGDKKFSMVRQTADGGYIAVGDAGIWSSDGHSFAINAIIVKLDVDGNVVWWKMYGDNDGYYDRAYSVQQTPDNGYIVAASNNNYNAWVFKIDAQGALQWQKSLALSKASGMIANSVQTTSDGGYVVSGGYTDLATYQQEAYILKLDAEGAIQRQRIFKPSSSYGATSALRIEETKDSGYIVQGYLSNHPWLMKLDQDWNVLWQYSHYGTWYGTYSDIFSTMQQASDGGYILAGTAISFNPQRSRQIILLKLDSAGKVAGCAASLVHDIAPLVVTTKSIAANAGAGQALDAPFVAASGPVTAYTGWGSNGTVCIDKDPNISISPSALDFGTLEFPAESSKTVTITNTGYADLIVDRISIAGANSGSFSQTNNCSTVVPNSSCSAVVTFSASSLGVMNASLSIDSNDPDTPSASVALSGTAADTIAPVSTTMITGIPGAHDWYVSDVAISITGTDSGSAVKEIHFAVDGSETTISGNVAVLSLVSSGTHTIGYYAVDNAGNQEKAHSLTIMIDKTAPSITAAANPPSNAEGWNNTDVVVAFDCQDALSGIAFCPSPVTVTTEGAGQVITGTAVDKAGNTATASVTLNIDKTPPSVALAANPAVLWPPSHSLVDVLFSGSSSDVFSDVASTEITIVDEYGVYMLTLPGFGSIAPLEPWREGSDLDGRHYTVTVVVTDKAGNQSTSTTTIVVPHDSRSGTSQK